MAEALAEIEQAIQLEGQGGGALFSDPHHLRADARLLTRILGLGVLTPAQIEVHIKNASAIMQYAASKKGKDGKPRPDGRLFARLLDSLIKAAKVELDTRKYANPIAKQHKHEHTVVVEQSEPATLADRAASLHGDLLQELAQRGIVIDASFGPALGADGEPGGQASVEANGHGDAGTVPV